MRALKNFITLFIGDGISYLLNFFATVYLARTLDVSNFGKISFAFAFFSIGSFLTNLGLISVGARDIAQSIKTGNNLIQKRYITNVILLRQLLALISFVLLIIIAGVINQTYEVKLLIILYGLSLFPFAFLLEWAFLGWEKMTAVTISKIIVAVVYYILILILVKDIQQLTTVPLIFFASYALGALILFIIFLRRKHPVQCNCVFKSQFADLKHLLKNALPIGIGAILIQFSLNFNIIFLGLVKNNIEVGYFSASNKLLVFILIFDRVMNNTTFPIISRYFLEGKEKLSEVLSRLSKLVFLVSFPTCAGGFILARELSVFVYESKYEPSYLIFRILVWFFFITILNSLYTSSLIAGQKNKDYVSAIGSGVIANVLLNIVLVPLIGALGTAISLVTAELITLVFLTQKIKPIAQIKFQLKNILKPVLATIVMIIFIMLFHSRLTIIPLVIIAALIYILVIVLIKGINRTDFVLSKVNQ